VITLRISKPSYGGFLVDDPSVPGSPPVGRGASAQEALGDWVFHNRDRVGVEFVVDASAQADEMERRRRELAQR
jgi:hypothetical protein